LLSLLRQMKKILQSFAIALICGFCGIAFYALSDNHTSLSSAERLCAYVMAWPLIPLEHLGGVKNLTVPSTPAEHRTAWFAWIGLWIYYYAPLASWRRRRMQ